MPDSIKEMAASFTEGTLGLTYFAVQSALVFWFIGTIGFILHSGPNTHRHKDVGHFLNHLFFERRRLAYVVVTLGLLNIIMLVVGFAAIGIANS